MNKGQIFSIDFIIAMILVVLSIGIIFSAGQTKMFEIKEENTKQIMMEKTESALIKLLGDPTIECTIDTNLTLPFSIDKTKLGAKTSTPAKQTLFKEEMALQGYNVVLERMGESSAEINDTLSGENTFAVEADVMVCEGAPAYADLNACLVGNTSLCGEKLTKQKLILKVNK